MPSARVNTTICLSLRVLLGSYLCLPYILGIPVLGLCSTGLRAAGGTGRRGRADTNDMGSFLQSLSGDET